MVEKNRLRCLFGGVLDLTSCGLARPAIFVVPHGPARHEKWPTGPQADEARPAGHGVPPWPDSHRAVPARDRAVPGRAGPMPRYGLGVEGVRPVHPRLPLAVLRKPWWRWSDVMLETFFCLEQWPHHSVGGGSRCPPFRPPPSAPVGTRGWGKRSWVGQQILQIDPYLDRDLFFKKKLL